MTNVSMSNHGLIKRLLQENFLDQKQIDFSLIKSQEQNISLLEYLITNKLLHSDQFALATANYFGLPILNLDAFDKNFFIVSALKFEYIVNYQVLPLSQSHHSIYLAMADPTHKEAAINEIQFYTGKSVKVIIVSYRQIKRIIANMQNKTTESMLSDYKYEYNDDELEDFEIEEESESNSSISFTNDPPVVRFVHKLIIDAIQKGVSDLHFEPYEKSFRIRQRIDGILFEVASPPIALANRIAARIKVMSRLDIAEHRLPQDGRFKLKLAGNRSMNFRVSTCPTVNGEKIVVRILDPSTANLEIDALGFEPEQKRLFLQTIHQPQGMILVTGPTGSGKTVTLYTAITILNSSENNISTVEDPVEIYVKGINQVNINLKAGLTFSSALRAFLRQDPDILMVGEMRDLETAEIGIKAAQTGHLVLSTLHTNSATESLTRLINMGLPAYNIATSVSLIIAQRLIRKLCTQCKTIDKLAIKALENESDYVNLMLQKNLVLYKNNSKGCEHCHEGFKGRIGIFELLSITHQLSSAILAGANSMQVLQLAKENGMVDLRTSGILKVLAGCTSLEEINRITVGLHYGKTK